MTSFHPYYGPNLVSFALSSCYLASNFVNKSCYCHTAKLRDIPGMVSDHSSIASYGKSGKRISSSALLRKPQSEVPQPERLIVIGDVHGDVDAFQSALRMADLIDSSGKWCGGKSVLVQSGDVFDRGDHDLVVEELLYCMHSEAKEAGGSVHTILGNHEALNACMDHSFASRAAFLPFDDLKPEILELLGENGLEQLSGLPEWARCRIAAMIPGGPVGKMLAAHGVSIKVGDTLIAHGGILPHHLDIEGGLEGLNQRTHQWLTNKSGVPEELLYDNSPIWTRLYSSPDSIEPSDQAIEALEEVLHRTGTKRMIVGHTPQRMGINSAVDRKIWRIDTAMCALMGGKPEVLEICGDDITIITEYSRISASKRTARPRPLPKVEPEIKIDDM